MKHKKKALKLSQETIEAVIIRAIVYDVYNKILNTLFGSNVKYKRFKK